MKLDCTEFFDRLKASPPGQAIIADFEAQKAAARRKLLEERKEALALRERETQALRAKIPALDAAVASATKALHEARQKRLQLEDDLMTADARHSGKANRAVQGLRESAPECIDEFIAEAQARHVQVRRMEPTSVTKRNWLTEAVSEAHSSYPAIGELSLECVAVMREADALKETVATEAEALEAIARLRERIARTPESRQLFPSPSGGAAA